MYKSPVEVYVNDMLNQIHQQEENQIVAEVSQAVGINVEKEELIKALNYDRNQYSKGYKDGVNEVLDKIKAEILDEAEYAYADFDEYKYDILHAEPDELPDDDYRYGLRRAVEIINKYRRGDAE